MLFTIVAVAKSLQWAEGCKRAPTDLHRQCAAEHHGKIPRVAGDQEQVISDCYCHSKNSEIEKILKVNNCNQSQPVIIHSKI